MGGHRVPGTLRAGASAKPGAVRLPAASSNPASHHPAHPRRQTPRDGITTLCLPWGRAHAGWLLPTTHHQGGGSRAGPPNPCQPPPSSRQPCSGCPAESCSSLSRERYAVLQLSVGAGKQQGNVKNDGSLHHGSAEGLMSLCAPQGTTTLQGQPAPAASEHQVGKQHMRIEREAVESPKLVEEGCRALVR